VPATLALRTGQAVVYRAGSGAAQAVVGLQDNTVYYVIVPDPTNSPRVVQLAATQGDAFAGTALPVTAPPQGSVHSLSPVLGFGGVANLVGDLEPDTFALLDGASLTGT